ncbi:MAG: FAD-dependent thymidylate synthase, partial [Myxococcaceae bacterium]
PNAMAAVAEAYRAVMGLRAAECPDAEAIDRLLNPGRNPYRRETLNVGVHAPMMRALQHANFTFAKKISHTADSQDQRHRMTPGSRPVLAAQFLPGEPDVVVPALLEEVPEALDVFHATVQAAWQAIGQLLDAGVPAEAALYLLPNAFPIRFLESGELLHFHHKWVHRLCYTAQEEIWRASLQEVEQVAEVQPLIAQYLAPPCTLRRQASVTPFCPEGPRFCGLPVWRMELREFQRLL